jgi:hypothetical protein
LKIRLLQSIASATWSVQAGEVYAVRSAFAAGEVPADFATNWLNAGLAEVVAEERELESAALETSPKRKRR